ncbi:MAG: competence protein TfoX [Cryomorphaceae bacterium]|nr:competence protein TfoX [Cryomorphaceae bacterium]
MASDQQFVDFVLEQIDSTGAVSAKKMFGEYGLYVDDKIFGSICDNKLFIKPTAGGRAFAPEIAEAPPYTGAKNNLLVEDQIENREWLSELVKITVSELPPPKPKKKKKVG